MKKDIPIWTAQIIMGVMFIVASSWKIISHPMAVQNFESWGYPSGFYMIIGILELVGGILLFHPKTAGYACIILFSVIIGAIITHVVHEEWFILLKPVAHLAGLTVVFYFRFIIDFGKDDMDYLPLNKLA